MEQVLGIACLTLPLHCPRHFTLTLLIFPARRAYRSYRQVWCLRLLVNPQRQRVAQIDALVSIAQGQHYRQDFISASRSSRSWVLRRQKCSQILGACAGDRMLFQMVHIWERRLNSWVNSVLDLVLRSEVLRCQLLILNRSYRHPRPVYRYPPASTAKIYCALYH